MVNSAHDSKRQAGDDVKARSLGHAEDAEATGTSVASAGAPAAAGVPAGAGAAGTSAGAGGVDSTPPGMPHHEVPFAKPPRQTGWMRFVPGLALCLMAVIVSMALAAVIPYVSALLLAIILGVLLRNTVPQLPVNLDAGMTFASKKLLRLGIVFLGAQLVLSDIFALGWGVIAMVIVIVGAGFGLTYLVGRLLGISKDLSMLIGCGFSICGAAAVAGVESTLKSKKEDVAAAVALVVLFGTIMIGAVPLAAAAMGLNGEMAGMWAGGSTHEVAQVVAIGGIMGSEELKVAVIVKLARVLMLAPMIAILAATVGRRKHAEAEAGSKRPPIVPLFVVGFLALAIVRTLGWLPEWGVNTAGFLQTVLLTAAMFALGCGVHIKSLLGLGTKPLVLATLSTLIVAGLALGGVFLAV